MVNSKNTESIVQNTENRGMRVKVRVCGGDVVERRVWERSEDVIYLCSERCYEWLINGDNYRNPVAFPESAIVEYLESCASAT